MECLGVQAMSLQSCLTLVTPWTVARQAVHGILQARILEWVPFPSPGALPNPGDQTWVPCIGRWVLYH